MKLNKTKRGLELGAAITALVYCIFDLILEVVAFETLIDTISFLKKEYVDYYNSYMQSTVIAYIIGFFIGVALVIVELIFACKLLKKPIDTSNNFINIEDRFENELKKRKKTRICFIVFSSILAFVMLINCFQSSQGSSSTTTKIVGLLIFVTVIVLESIAMANKEIHQDVEIAKELAVSNSTIEEKIAELKHLKELGVIDEEQYKNAVEKNIRDIV
ncbi:MAG: hypothetical protein E7372_01405 [Clostridiales bacterium]|nr:hypothetical protein [Clostridiales bacterium]